ncbi:hypothetical protein BKD30_02215 [Tersicoccus phoenicis]|uniref:Methyltransferase type 11 domain-containing protein n=1 Tax=Tersicoccus phoenicis TaxID=554083 RepID=A0A1R1LL37_9MICC|nr:hypothetical protein BKD30_02215 [Tersicoccus phoenicis]
MASAVGLLACPVCGEAGLTATSRRSRVGGLSCPAGHHWDANRQGVVNLLTGAGTRFTPDTPDMVAARDRFLGAGHYEPIAAAVATAVLDAFDALDARPGPAAVLDAGAGTGYYLDAVLTALAASGGSMPGAETDGVGSTEPGTGPGAARHRGPAAVATDLSPVALRRLTRAVPAALPLVWDTWRRLPLRDAAVDVVLAVFAPRNLPEFARVLTDGGVLVLVTPQPGHLDRLRRLTGMLAVDPDKEARVRDAVRGHFTVVAERDVDVPLRLGLDEAADAAFMGPAGHHLGAEELTARLSGVTPPVDVDARVTVHTLRPWSAD